MSEHHDTPHPVETHDTPGEATAETLHVDRYEGIWIRVSVAVLALFFVLVAVSAFSTGFQVPGVTERIDPTTLYDPGSPFAEPGLRELAPGKYEAYIRAQIWQFAPNEIRIPAGSTVTFYITSQDVLHGIKIQNTNVNMMAIPGQITRLSHTFEEPGTYNYICHEYCGQLHHMMWGQIIVEEPVAEQAQVQ